MTWLIRPTEVRHAVRIAATYVVVSALWIALSDQLASAVAPDTARLSELQTIKGWTFVVATGLLLFYLVRSALRSLSRSRAELGRSEQMLEQVAEHTGASIWAYGIEAGRMIYMSPGSERVWGCGADEMQAGPQFFMNRIHPDDRPRIAGSFGTVRKLSEEYRVTRADGKERWLRTLSSPVAGPTGRTSRVVGITEDVTDVKRRERVLRESEERFSATFHQAAVGMAHVGVDGRWLRVNRRLCEITGYTEAELLERTFQSITHPEDVAADVEEARRLWAGETPSYSMEKRYLRKDGSAVWVNLTVSVVADAAGRPKYFVAVVEDITERKRALAALRESEERFKQLSENIPEVFWITSVDKSEMLYVSRAYESVWGRSAEGLLQDATQWLEAVHQDDRARVAAALPRQKEGTYDEEYRILTPDGQVRWIRERAFPVRDRRGQVHRVAGLAEDITDFRRREQDLRLLAAAIDQAGEGVMITDSDGGIEYVNPAFEKITGFARDEAVGRTPLILKSGKQDRADYRTMWQTLLAGKPIAQRITNRRKDGTRYVQDSVVTPVRSGGAEITHMVAVLRDVTHEIALEEQVRQSQKMEAVGRLAGGIAHDFNNMLTAIKGHAQFALDEVSPSSAARDDLTEVLSSADRAQALTRQLLAFSRQQVSDPRVLEVHEALRGADRLLRRLIGEDVELELRIAAEVGRVRIDPTHLDQVLMNLAVNARDAMPDGGRLTMEAENVELTSDLPHGFTEPFRPGRYVWIRVSDTGTGMDAPTRERIFEPFFTTKAPGRGTGLGLSTVFGIVKQSDGFIRVESGPGAGTRFEIFLPRTEEAPELSSDGAGTGSPATGGSETVLVVEDQAGVRSVARRALQRAGYRVLEAENGHAALGVWQREAGRIHLVVTDMVMPHMGGPELARRLRQDQQDLPVIFMTGHVQEDVLQEIGDLTTACLLEKPFNAEQLRCKVREVLDAS